MVRRATGRPGPRRSARGAGGAGAVRPAGRLAGVSAGVLAALPALALAACGAQAGAGPVGQERVLVLAAASLTDPFTELAARFEARHDGVDVVLSFAGSGSLVQQVLAGAPADVLATASRDSMDQAVAAGVTAGPPLPLARAEVVLAVPEGNPAGVTSVRDLGEDGLVVALCAEQVPCGRATTRVLAEAGVTAAPDTLEQDVRAVLTRLRLGEADAGVVYASDVAASAGEVEAVAWPEELRAVAGTELLVVPLAEAPSPEAAADFVVLVTSQEGREVLRGAGLAVP